MGEIAGDEALMPYITSANIACGGHAGDEVSMRATVALAERFGVAVGAHPSYPDRENFGRIELDLDPTGFVYDQTNALAAIATIRHVKPHGALYNKAVRDPATARAIAEGVAQVSRDLVLVGLAQSAMIAVFRDCGFRTAAEAFADRRYEADGTLRPRNRPGALIIDPDEAAEQALELAKTADTICVHGDTQGAAEILRAVRARLVKAGFEIRALPASAGMLRAGQQGS